MAGGFNIPDELENMMVVLLRLSHFERGPLLERGVLLSKSVELFEFLPDEEVSGEAGQLFRLLPFFRVGVVLADRVPHLVRL